MPSITYLAETNHRNTRKRFGIKERDRLSHLYIIGRTGTGKSTLLKNLFLQDAQRGDGCALLDPHGDLADEIVRHIPDHRQSTLHYLNPSDPADLWRLNPLADIPAQRRTLAADGIVETFKKLWSEEWGPRLEHLLRNVVWLLLENEGSSFGDIPRVLSNKDYREGLVQQVANKEVRAFWRDEYTGYSDRFRAVIIAPLQNKVGAFLTDPVARRVVTGARSSLDLRRAMDTGEIIVANLAKGHLGESTSSLLGSLLVSSLSLAALSRADRGEATRRPFWLYLDEFQNFATLSLATTLSELRKYGLGLTLAHQYLGQLPSEIREAVFGNVGTFLSFRVGALDAPLVARELSPTFSADDLLSLPNYSIYLRLMIDGEVSRAFSARTCDVVAYSCSQTVTAPLRERPDAIGASLAKGYTRGAEKMGGYSLGIPRELDGRAALRRARTRSN